MGLSGDKVTALFNKLDVGSESEDERIDKIISPEDLACKQRVEGALEDILVCVKDPKWRIEKTLGSDVVLSLKLPSNRRIYKLVGDVEASPEVCIQDLYHRYDDISWNPTLYHVKRLQEIDDHTDVLHVTTSEAAAGLISKRDYTYLRTWQKRQDTYILALISSAHHCVPHQKGVIRGEQGPTGYILTSSQDNSHCEVQWILNTSLKGWIPQYLLDRAMPDVMLEHIHFIRKLQVTRKETERDVL